MSTTRRSTPLLLLVLLLAALAPACGSGATESAPEPPPVLVFGVDGFEWSVILPLLRAGEMPNLAGLMERGVYGELATQEPAISPRLWATMATGKPPEEHGILSFTVATGDGWHRLATSRDRKCKAYWNILTDAGIASDTIGWWNTFPVEEVSGLMVAQTNTENRFGVQKGTLQRAAGDQVWPRDAEEWVFATAAETNDGIADRLREIFGGFDAALDPPDKERWKQCRWAFRADATYVSVLEQRTQGGVSSRVTSIYLGGTDVVGHRFWAAHDPGSFGLDPSSAEVIRFGHVIESYYRYVDGILGRFLDRFPEQTTVLVVADHGMAADVSESARPGAELDVTAFTGDHDGDDHGVFVAAGPNIAPSPPASLAELRADELPTLGGIADLCPTLLALVGVPYGDDMGGRPIESLFTEEFLARSPIRSVPTHEEAGWRAGRSPAPIVRDPERIQQLKNLGYLQDEDP